MKVHALRWLTAGALLGMAFVGGRLASAEGQPSKDGVWWPVSTLAAATAGADRWLPLDRFHGAVADTAKLREILASAPTVATPGLLPTDDSGVLVDVPLPDGSYARFRVWNSPVMEPGLASTLPEVSTYAGRGVDDPTLTLRCDWTPFGFHAQVLAGGRTSYVEPLWKGDVSAYACYRGPDAAALAGSFGCETIGAAADFAPPPDGRTAATSGANLRTYRVAVAATGEYTANFGGTVAGAGAAIATAVNNLNGIFNVEIAVQMNVVATNANVVFTDASTDPFPLANLNAEAQAAIDAGIGDANYDIGHLFHDNGGSISGNAGGIGTVCQSGIKGSGWSQAGTPSGGNWTFLTAHEMGHQYGANHTWNGTGCGPEVSAARYEPGSGSTIMSYSSICGADNQQGSAVGNLYFHTGSIDQIVAYTTVGAGNGCPTVTPTGNAIPTVNGGADHTIPQSTPFELTATGADGNGGSLTYCWEQFNLGNKAALNAADEGTIPLFRSFSPTAASNRVFPALADLLAGSASLFPNKLGEQLPTTNRTLAFRVTVRDNQAGGGGVNTDDVALTVDAASGPFAVTAPNGGETWDSAVAQTVTWNVAGTSVAPVSTANVAILLSTDGGLTYPFTLAASTANDGSHVVTLPSCELAATCRIKVAALGNVYFDLSDADFTIEDATPPVVTTAVVKAVLWPASKGMIDVGLSSSATDDCDGTPVFQSITVHSDEGNGAAPYAPDAALAGSAVSLRSERAVPGNGRVYLIVVRYVDDGGNVGLDVRSVVVPTNMTAGAVSALLATAAADAATCETAAGAPPPGYVTILP
jgi:hypothetical protein